MRPLTESAEVFEAYARIDFCYYSLEMIQEQIKKSKPQTPLDMLIDNSTGYSSVKEPILAAISLTQEIIRSKQIIGADYSINEKALESFKNLLKKLK